MATLRFAEWNSTKRGHMLGSECDLIMHVRNLGYPLPLQNRAQKPPFSTISQLNGNFNMVYITKQMQWQPEGSPTSS